MSSVDTDLIKQKCTYAGMSERGGGGKGRGTTGPVPADFDKSVNYYILTRRAHYPSVLDF